MRPSLRPLPLLLLGLLAACASGGPPRGFERPEGAAMMPRLFVSPAGKPFRPSPGAPPIEAWFGEADADGDGALGFAEFQADFRRWFAALDTDGDGEIAPAEVTRYETEILPEMASYRSGLVGPGGGGRVMRGPGGGGRGMGGGPRGGRGGGRMAMAAGAARFGLLPIPHPIMAADLDMNRGVTRAEFDRAAASRFNLLDEARNGRLALAALQARLRPRPAPEGRQGSEARRERRSPDGSGRTQLGAE